MKSNENGNKRQVTLTAQVPEDTNVYQFTTSKKHLKGKPPYVRIFSGMTRTMAKDKDFNLTDLRVFLALLDHTEYENTIDVSQQALADDLKIPRPEVSKSLKKLVTKGYIEIFDQRGRQNIYRLNPHVAFKTRSKNLEDLCQEFAPVERL